MTMGVDLDPTPSFARSTETRTDQFEQRLRAAPSPWGVNASVYIDLDDDERFEQLVSALCALARAYGLDGSERFRLERGSRFQRLRLWSRDPVTREELRRRKDLAEHALVQQTLGQTQAEINEKQAVAAATAHQLIQGDEEQVVQFGSIVAVAERSPGGQMRRYVFELTHAEVIALNKSRRTLKSPIAFFDFLGQRRPEFDVELGRCHGSDEAPPQLPPAPTE